MKTPVLVGRLVGVPSVAMIAYRSKLEWYYISVPAGGVSLITSTHSTLTVSPAGGLAIAATSSTLHCSIVRCGRTNVLTSVPAGLW